jgi:uncharacterized protein YjiS (DUF1127 family)
MNPMNIFTALMQRSKDRRAEYEMLRLDDHLLRDIGVSRDDVRRMMAGARTAHSKSKRREG